MRYVFIQKGYVFSTLPWPHVMLSTFFLSLPHHHLHQIPMFPSCFCIMVLHTYGLLNWKSLISCGLRSQRKNGQGRCTISESMHTKLPHSLLMVAWKEFLPPHLDLVSLSRDLVCGFYVFPQCEAHSISADPARKEGCCCLNHQILIYIMLHDLLHVIRYVWSHRLHLNADLLWRDPVPCTSHWGCWKATLRPIYIAPKW